jgi:hypothetical protein
MGKPTNAKPFGGGKKEMNGKNFKELMKAIVEESQLPPTTTAAAAASVAAATAPPPAAATEMTKMVSVSAAVAHHVGCPASMPMLPLGVKKCPTDVKLLDKAAYAAEWYAIKADRYYLDTVAVFKGERDYVVRALRHAEKSVLVVRPGGKPVILFKAIQAAMPKGKAEGRGMVVDSAELLCSTAVSLDVEAEDEPQLMQWQIPESVAAEAADAALISRRAFDERLLLVEKPERIVQLDDATDEAKIAVIRAMAQRHHLPVCTVYPVANIVSSRARALQLTVKQRYYPDKKSRAECVVNALKLATELACADACAYANGTNVRIVVGGKELKAAVKEHLRTHAKWAGFLPENEAFQFEEDVYAAWGHAAAVNGAATTDDASDLVKLHQLTDNEEIVVVRGVDPLPKNIAAITSKMGLTFLAKRSDRVAFAKADIGRVVTLQKFLLAGKPLYAQRLGEWTAECV